MVGKLFLDLGQDYAFDIRRAREVAEGGGPPLPPAPFVEGPISSEYGQDYWLQRDDRGKWWIWFDIDADPDPDIRQRLRAFLRNPSIDPNYRADVREQAELLGWEG